MQMFSPLMNTDQALCCSVIPFLDLYDGKLRKWNRLQKHECCSTTLYSSCFSKNIFHKKLRKGAIPVPVASYKDNFQASLRGSQVTRQATTLLNHDDIGMFWLDYIYTIMIVALGSLGMSISLPTGPVICTSDPGFKSPEKMENLKLHGCTINFINYSFYVIK